MKQCSFCTNNVKNIDYKDVDALKKFLGAQAKIKKKSGSGICSKHQRKLAQAVKRARFLALLAFVGE